VNTRFPCRTSQQQSTGVFLYRGDCGQAGKDRHFSPNFEGYTIMAAELALQNQPQQVALLEITPDKIELIKRTVAVGASNDELSMFLHQARRTGLDPLAKQIYCIKRGGKMTIQVGIDGLRLVAQRTEKMDGQDGPYWCGDDGVWKDVWLSKEKPAACKVVVFRKGESRGYNGVARMAEYYQPSGGMWDKLPATMLAKVAESIALRKAFPQELSGVYSQDEMDQAGGSQAAIVTAPTDAELKAELLRTGWSWAAAVDAMNRNNQTTYPATVKPQHITPSELSDFHAWLKTQPNKPAAPAPTTDQPAANPAANPEAIKALEAAINTANSPEKFDAAAKLLADATNINKGEKLRLEMRLHDLRKEFESGDTAF
jgi:phage recombination protein Bet